ncbi:LOG family protein [Niallia sp. 03133]|uniref:LOG family protein n=1 Tax=Niallia sp. 03133 TaxID=3458060 RepID=UPI0040449835
MKRIAVFCGSSNGASPIYLESAKALGKELAKREIELVYGGSCVGLMGAVADAVLHEGGKATGVLPHFLAEKEIAHKGITNMIVVDSMHERKAKMAELADGFITLPGGAGTLEEFFEIFTWAQLGLHQKPCGIFNINHYYEPLIRLIHHMADAGFLQEKFREMALVASDPITLLDQFYTYKPPTVKIFLTENQT